MRREILFVVFAGALGYTLGLILGFLGIVIAMAIVFVLGMHLTNHDTATVSNPMLINKPYRVRIRYRCLSCYTIHNKRECPKCGSKMKHVEF